MAEFRPTRSIAVKPQGASGADLSGVFDVAKSTAKVGETIGSFANNLLDLQYSAAEDAQVIDAVKTGLKVINPDGSINPDVMNNADKFWSSKANQKLLSTVNTVSLSSANNKAKVISDSYLKSNPYGDEPNSEKIKQGYNTSISDIETKLAEYPEALAQFRSTRSNLDLSIGLSQAANRQDREYTQRLNDDKEAHNTLSLLTLRELVDAGFGGNTEALEDILNQSKLLSESISANPANPNENKLSTINALQSQLYQNIASGGLIHIVNNKISDSLNNNLRDPDSILPVRLAGYEIAEKIENEVGYLEEILAFSKVPTELRDLIIRNVDVFKLANTLRSETDQAVVNLEAVNSENARVASKLVAQEKLAIGKANTVEGLAEIRSRLPSVVGKEVFTDEASAEAELLILNALSEKKSSIQKQSSARHTAQQKALTNQYSSLINAISKNDNTGTTSTLDEIKTEVKNAYLSGVFNDYPELRNKVINAFIANKTALKGDIDDIIKVNTSIIKSLPYGSEERELLEQQTNELAKNANPDAVATWIDFTTTTRNTITKSNIETDIKNITNGLPLQHFKNAQDMLDYSNKYLGGNLNNNIVLALHTGKGNNLEKDLSFLNARLASSFVKQDGFLNIDFTPQAYQETINSTVEYLRKRYPNREKEINDYIKTQEGKARDYTVSWDKRRQELEELKIYQENATDGVNANNVADIERLDPPPKFTDLDPAYIDQATEWISRYHIIPTDFLDALQTAVFDENPEEKLQGLVGFLSETGQYISETKNMQPDTVKAQFYNQLTNTKIKGAKGKQIDSDHLVEQIMISNFPVSILLENLNGSVASSDNSLTKGFFNSINVDGQQAMTNDAFMLEVAFKNISQMKEGFWEKVTESFGAEELGLEKDIQDFISQTVLGDGAQVWQESIQANPYVEAFFADTIRSKLISKGNQIGHLTREDFIAVTAETILALNGLLGYEITPVGPANFTQQARILDLSNKDLPTDRPGTIGILGALTRTVTDKIPFIGTDQLMNFQISVVRNPVIPHFETHGNLPPELKSHSLDILHGHIADVAEAMPDKFFEDRGVTKQDALLAIHNNLVSFKSQDVFAADPNPKNRKYDVYLNIGKPGTSFPTGMLMMDDFVPNFEAMGLFRNWKDAYTKGVDFSIMNNDLFRIHRAWYTLGIDKFAFKNAFLNSINTEPPSAYNKVFATIWNQFSAPDNKIDLNSDWLEKNQNFWKFFIIPDDY